MAEAVVIGVVASTSDSMLKNNAILARLKMLILFLRDNEGHKRKSVLYFSVALLRCLLLCDRNSLYFLYLYITCSVSKSRDTQVVENVVCVDDSEVK